MEEKEKKKKNTSSFSHSKSSSLIGKTSHLSFFVQVPSAHQGSICSLSEKHKCSRNANIDAECTINLSEGHLMIKSD